MRFVFISLGYYPEIVGGAYRYVTELAERLASRGHAAEVIFPAPAEQTARFVTRHGVRLHSFDNAEGHFFFNWRAENARARALLEKLQSAHPTLLVPCHAFFGPALRSAKSPAAFLFTGPWAEEYQFSRKLGSSSAAQRWKDTLIAAGMRRVERRALTSSAEILTISQFYERMLPVWHPAPLPPVKMISGGVDTERFQPAAAREAVRQKLGLAPSDFLFFTLRRLDPRMGLLKLVDAFAEVSREFPQARLWMGGTGPQRDELQARAASHKLGGRIRLPGFIPDQDLNDYYSAADCTVMPSLDLEGFGLSTVESLACGAPVLGSSSGATPELLRPLKADLLFDGSDPRDLPRKLRGILNGDIALPSREKCRAYAAAQFSWDRPVAACEASFVKLCGGRA